MMLRRTASFSFAAACMTAIATMPAHAQMGGPYGTTRATMRRRAQPLTAPPRATLRRRAQLLTALHPPTTPRRATPRRRTKAVRHNRRQRAEMLSRADNTIGKLKQIARSAKRVCARNVARLPTRNSVKAALRASIKRSLRWALRPRAGVTAANPADKSP